MLKALLLTIVAGAGAANIPSRDLLERGNNPPSNKCCVKDKCPQAAQQSSVTAYCSSYLNIPKTATKTVTTCTTTTVGSTKITATVTVPATVITTVVTGCQLPPSSTTTTTSTTQAPGGGDSSAPAPEGKRDADPETHERRGNTLSKPSCLSSYKAPQDISSACRCLSLQPQTTKTTTVTDVKTVSKNIQTAATVTGGPSTKTVYQSPTKPTFIIANDNRKFFLQSCGQKKRAANCDTPYFDAGSGEGGNGYLEFTLSSADGFSGTASNLRGPSASEILGITAAQNRRGNRNDYLVNLDSSASLTPLSCSISFNTKDGTCPLSCQPFGGDTDDVNQSEYTNDTGVWFLGPAGAAYENTYKNFAVSPENVPSIR